MQNKYKRGEICYMDVSPGKGYEHPASGPVLIIQNDIGNTYSPNTIVALMTTAVPVGNNFPFIVVCSPRDSGMDKMNAIDLASIMTVSGTRIGDKCGQLSATKMLEVDEAIKNSLGLT
jgi:mRNA interferase MazF